MVNDIKDRAEVPFKNRKEDKTQGIGLLPKKEDLSRISQKCPLSVILWRKKKKNIMELVYH